jgi:hypothetical protein
MMGGSGSVQTMIDLDPIGQKTPDPGPQLCCHHSKGERKFLEEIFWNIFLYLKKIKRVFYEKRKIRKKDL